MTASKNGYADKASILAANKRRYVDVPIPGIGTVRIRSLTERERSEYEAGFLDGDGKATNLVDSKVRLIVLCICNADGERLFSREDKPGISSMDAIVTNRLADVCREHCGFTDEDIEVLAKNLEPTADADSPTG